MGIGGSTNSQKASEISQVFFLGIASSVSGCLLRLSTRIDQKEKIAAKAEKLQEAEEIVIAGPFVSDSTATVSGESSPGSHSPFAFPARSSNVFVDIDTDTVILLL